MQRIIHTCLAVATLVAGGFVIVPEASAQRGPRHHNGRMGPEDRLERHIDMLDARLDLTADQEAQIRALLEAHAKDMRTWRENNDSATREDRRAHVRESFDGLQTEVRAILTPQQTEQLQEMRERFDDRRGDRRHRRQHRRHARHDMKKDLLEQLDLTDEQKEQLRSLREAHRGEMEEWREENPDASREDRRDWMREQAAAHREARMVILTPDQRAMLDDLRAEWREKMTERRERKWKTEKEQADDAGTDEGAAAGTEDASPTRFGLENYPNPFNPSTEIRFHLPQSGLVELGVYDARGREVRSLLNETLSEGPHSVRFEADDLPSGVYLYRLTFGDHVETGRMTLAK